MRDSDAAFFTAKERAQGWHTEQEKFLMRLRDQAEGRAAALVAKCDGEPAGYIHVYPDAHEGPCAGRGWPEIVDFAVLERFRGKGVGLHGGYGAAQRMYIHRGYVPDGSGVWYGNQPCPPYAPCRNDDDLVLYLAKRLGSSGRSLRHEGEPGVRDSVRRRIRAAGLTCV
ncbi:MAG: GNAT family N-acetyltransferase [Aristaeellaceae bacterium]